MDIRDLTIGALAGAMGVLAPAAAMARWIARLWIRDELKTLLDERDKKLMQWLKLEIENAILKDKGKNENPNHSGTWPPAVTPK